MPWTVTTSEAYATVVRPSLEDTAAYWKTTNAELMRGLRARHMPATLFVIGDKDLLYRAFYNILVNAYQAIDHDGTIRIQGIRRGDGMMALSFHDSGPGFPPKLISKLLDPFFTTKDHGTGLGLPIVNTIITSHGGQLLLTNPEDGGAMITILLPVASEPDISHTADDAADTATSETEPVLLTDPLPQDATDAPEAESSAQTQQRTPS